MHIEQELRNWLESTIPNRQREKSRNTQIVLNYYGFGDLPWPTLEDIANQFSMGNRERIRQIINSSFRDHISDEQLPIANSTFLEIEKYTVVSIPELRKILLTKGLASAGTTVRGVLNLARDLNRCKEYDLYDTSLDRVSRFEAEFDSNTFLIHSDALAELKAGLKKARTLPGQLGLSRFEYLRSELGDGESLKRLLSFIRESPETVRISANSQNWYIYEDRDNTLVNFCEKIFSVADRLDIEVLASTLQNALRRRSHKYEYPSSNVILRWIESSRWFKVTGRAVAFLGETRELTVLEQSVVDYLQSVKYSQYPPLKDHLLAKGYGKPAIDKAVLTSPLVTVDRSGQRKTYRYALVSKAGAVTNTSEHSDRYHDLKNRLKSLLTTGTDNTVDGLSRREQSILREWVFRDAKEANCAICGEVFSVSALVTAHKKKRSICSDAERVDPYIVFPLCVFGCDYLYESGTIKVSDGKVVLCAGREASTQDFRRAQTLNGIALHEDWLQGDLSYFE